MKETMEDLIKEAVSDADLVPAEIPMIDLYLDQILSLVMDKNAEGSEIYKDRVLTKTMINNYSKEGAILPIKGKKYNRRQILQILFIYSLKGTLMIGEIKRIFDGLNEIEGFGNKEFEALWVDYLKMKDHSRGEVERLCRDITEGGELDLEKDEDYLRLLLSVVSLSSYLRTVAQAMIAARYPVLEEKDDKEDKKEEKKEKKEKKEKEKSEKKKKD